MSMGAHIQAHVPHSTHLAMGAHIEEKQRAPAGGCQKSRDGALCAIPYFKWTARDNGGGIPQWRRGCNILDITKDFPLFQEVIAIKSCFLL